MPRFRRHGSQDGTRGFGSQLSTAPRGTSLLVQALDWDATPLRNAGEGSRAGRQTTTKLAKGRLHRGTGGSVVEFSPATREVWFDSRPMQKASCFLPPP